MLKRQKDLVVRDWQQDKINLIQFPRAAVIPTASPFALKLECWLRFTKLNYTNVSNNFKIGSSKGQIPFIELNGRQLADSNFIIDNLKNIFNVSIDRNLTSLEKANERAYSVMIEESLARTLLYSRSKDFSWVMTDKGLGRHFPGGMKKFFAEKVLFKRVQKAMKSIANAQGIGRHSPAEVEEIAKKDLGALSTLLGSKAYFFGDRPSTLDATAFGHLAQFIEAPVAQSDIKAFIDQNAPNLVEFVHRVKKEFWPDWDILCKNLVMNASDVKSSEPTA